MKIIAYYLPQFHEIPENDKWWGKGYTEWKCVKNAKPLFNGHAQPRIPLNNNYYNLLEKKTQKWQTELARKYGIYGFCIYHYWFNGKILLEKPLEAFRDNKELNLHYCICWANENWTNGWVSNNPDILIEQTYGNENEWEEHFYYLLPFFKDERYLRKDDMPILVIYRPELINELDKMLQCWRRLAKNNGLKGLVILSQKYTEKTSFLLREHIIDYMINYEPGYTVDAYPTHIQKIFGRFNGILDRIAKTNYFSEIKFLRPLVKKDYDFIWSEILKRVPNNSRTIPGAFVDWDNTPRKKRRGSVFVNANPYKFYNYIKKQIINAQEKYNSDILFLFAWNEWGEGGYLEPDTINKYGYLEAIFKALTEVNEFPKDI